MKVAPLALALLACCLPTLGAQPVQDAAPLDANQVLRELEAAQAKQQQLTQGRRQQTTKVLQEALGPGTASANLYEEAVRATQFAGRAKESSDFSAWSKKNADLLRSPEMREAIQFHIRYLLLSLRRAEDPGTDLAGESLQYAADLAGAMAKHPANRPPREAAELLGKPVSEGVFARWLLLDGRLPDPKLWEPSAGNLPGILEKNVRAPWRKQRNPELLRTWEIQIGLLNASAQDSSNNVESERIATLALPSALFARANDRVLLGQPNRAAAEILQIVRSHPAHPDWPAWVARLKELVQPAPTPAP